MPRPANPLTGIAKKLESLKAKSERLTQEIADLSALVAKEAGKVQTAVPASTGKKSPAKKVATKAQGEPKKRGRPAKVKSQNAYDPLSMLNADPSDIPATPKKRGKR